MKLIIPLFAFLLILSSCGTGGSAEADQQRQDSLLQAQEDSLLSMFGEELKAIDEEISAINTSNGIFHLDTSENEVIRVTTSSLRSMSWTICFIKSSSG